MTKLVVHIGHGKTGSSSIQASLLAARPALEAQGVRYLGLMLEHAAAPDRKSWQFRGGSDLFFGAMPAAAAISELTDVLLSEMERVSATDTRVAIWSNEWIIQRPEKVLPALQTLVSQGIDVELQAYIRRHDKWAVSAYSQWGLKHKSYTGPVREFSEWLPVSGNRDIRFAADLAVWDTAFGNALRVFNFDAAGDVVQHFLTVNEIRDVAAIQENRSPSPTATAAQAVYNSRFKAPVRPSAFDSILNTMQARDENGVLLPALEQLMPSPAQLEKLVADRAEDIREINTLLARNGEPELSFDVPPRVAEQPSAWEMEQVMLKMIYTLFEELQSMRRQISSLEKKLYE